MNPDKELIEVANFVEKMPTSIYDNGLESKKGWWKWEADDDAGHWVPNKDPRESMDVAMEVLEHKDIKAYNIDKNRYSLGDKKNILVYEVRVTIVEDHEPMSRYCNGETLKQAIFNAVVKLIDYLKEKEND